MTTARVIVGDCREVLRALPSESVQCCVTSPPYFGLRDYGTGSWEGGDPLCEHRPLGTTADPKNPGSSARNGKPSARDAAIFAGHCSCGATRVDQQIGLEETPDAYVAELVAVFREVRRVLRDDGTLWLNLGDSYAADRGGTTPPAETLAGGVAGQGDGDARRVRRDGYNPSRYARAFGLKHKDLIGIPWMVARALQAPYYTGRIKSEADRAWLAGFLDGEGTISYVERDRGPDHSPTHDVRIFVTNCDDGPLRHFAAMTAGNVYQHDGERENRYGARPCFRWQMGTHDGALLLRELFPYLRTKRKQAALVWTLFTTLRHQNGHARTPADVIEKRRVIAAMVRALNAGDPVDVPDWVESPPSTTEPGYHLRQDIIWHKPNPMPESVRDRCTKAHEYLFLLAKSERYHFDADAIREPDKGTDHRRNVVKAIDRGQPGASPHTGLRCDAGRNGKGANKRSVWTVNTARYNEAHFATFPPELIRPCVAAGCPIGGTVLDPFNGSGTTGQVALELGRSYLGIELNPDYAAMTERRLRAVTMGLPLEVA